MFAYDLANRHQKRFKIFLIKGLNQQLNAPLKGSEKREPVKAAVKDIVKGLFSFFNSGGMVRLVGPNERPLEKHEFETQDGGYASTFGGLY